jgi:hypothetical protein
MANFKERYDQFSSDLRTIKNAVAVAAAVPRFLRERITPQQAEEAVKKLVETRVERFLELIRLQIYGRLGSPYLKLLKHAGCEFSDLQTQVHRHGLEETLTALAKEGVYLTSDEYKGKREVVRGRESFRITPRDFECRAASAGFTMQSSGTRNAPVSTFNSLDWRTQRIMGNAVAYAACDVFSSAYAVYQPIISGRVAPVLGRAKIGIATDRWFAPKMPINSWLEGQYHYLSTSLIVLLANWFGPGMARPEFLESGDVRPIVEWILKNRRDGKKCCIQTVPSNAVRIARTALELGVTLEGTTFLGGGEPLTQSKRALIERVKANVLVTYAFGGNINVGQGCGNPAFTDEVHVQESLVAVVEHPRPLDDSSPPIHPLLGTTLHPLAPRLLLNVENGDYATMVRRDCGCALERVGFTQHLHTIRSFEKFTSEGMNYFGSDLFELLENVIPSEFGGGPGDYQLVEEEDERGQTRLTLVVHPELGEINEAMLLLRLQQALAQGSRNQRFMSKIWQDAGTFRIRREVPHASDRGKILPLHIKQKNL